MTRHARLVSLLVAIMALSGAIAAPATTSQSARLLVTIAWFSGDRAEAQVRQHQPRPMRRSAIAVVFVAPGDAPAPSTALPLSRFQRPPPTIASGH